MRFETAAVGDHGETKLEQRAERAVRSELMETVRRTASPPWRATLSAWRGAPPSVTGRPGAAERSQRDHGEHVLDPRPSNSAISLLVDPSMRASLATLGSCRSGRGFSGPLVDGVTLHLTRLCRDWRSLADLHMGGVRGAARRGVRVAGPLVRRDILRTALESGLSRTQGH